MAPPPKFQIRLATLGNRSEVQIPRSSPLRLMLTPHKLTGPYQSVNARSVPCAWHESNTFLRAPPLLIHRPFRPREVRQWPEFRARRPVFEMRLSRSFAGLPTAPVRRRPVLSACRIRD